MNTNIISSKTSLTLHRLNPKLRAHGVPPSGGPGRVNAEVQTASRQRYPVLKLGLLSLLATFCAVMGAQAGVVTSTADDGSPGTLRAVIAAAAAGDTITFDGALTGQTITLTGGQLAINQDLIITGPGANQLAISGNNAGRVFCVDSGVTATIQGLTVRDGRAQPGSQAIPTGGGIYNRGTLTVNNCTFSGNSADDWGSGGGLCNENVATVNNSTFSGNSGTQGGGIYDQGTLTVNNSTFSGNSATSHTWGGGGIFAAGTTTVSSCTFSGNSGTYGGGIFSVRTLNIKNSIIANSPRGGNCYVWSGSFNAAGVNFSDDYTCPGFLHVTSTELNLGPLADNGGPTMTHALLAPSLAIGTSGDCTDWFGNPLTTDQRGVARPQGAACDVGAYEQSPPSDLPLAANDSYTLYEGGTLLMAAPGVLSNDSDPYSAPLAVFAATSPAHGSLTINADGSFTYTPVALFHGADSFTYLIADSQNRAAAASVSINVVHVNHAPTALAQSLKAPESTPTQIKLSGSDVDGDQLSFSIVRAPSHGTLTGTSPALFYTSAANYTGMDSFTFKANDGALDSAPATVSIEVRAPLVVTTLADEGSSGTLRSVMATALPGDFIVFAVTGTITLSGGQLVINKDLIITGPGANQLAISGNNAGRVIYVDNGVTATIQGLTVRDGNADTGGGIMTFGALTVSDCALSDNSGNEGGGLFSQGVVTVVRSTISGNSALEGGGILNYEDAINSGTLTISSSTISGNSASIQGGGIANWATLTISSSTISDNSASGHPYSIAGGLLNAMVANIKNSIIANNPGGDCLGSFTAVGVNFDTDGSGPGFTHVTSEQLALGPLADNGGPTMTHVLLADSVAIDAATDSTDWFGNPVTTDQRGVARPQGAAGDVGAFELIQNRPPVAQCRNVTVSAGANCSANASIDNGSHDPDAGDTVNISQSPLGPYPLGQTLVTLTITDSHNASSQCQATVTVIDDQLPAPDATSLLDVVAQCSAVRPAAPTATDACDGRITATTTAPATFGQGDFTIVWTFTDSHGNSVSQNQQVHVHDTAPPSVSCPADVTAITTSANGMIVNYPAATAIDNCSTPTIAYLKTSGSTFGLGTTAVNVTATDAVGRSARCAFNVSVVYSWSGFLPPINANGSSVFKLGTTVGVKFLLTGASAGITNAVAKFSYSKLSNTVPGSVNEPTSTAAATKGNLFRCDPTTKQYVFNWSTKGLTAGTYQLKIDLGDGVSHTVNVGLK